MRSLENLDGPWVAAILPANRADGCGLECNSPERPRMLCLSYFPSLRLNVTSLSSCGRYKSRCHYYVVPSSIRNNEFMNVEFMLERSVLKVCLDTILTFVGFLLPRAIQCFSKGIMGTYGIQCNFFFVFDYLSRRQLRIDYIALQQQQSCKSRTSVHEYTYSQSNKYWFLRCQ